MCNLVCFKAIKSSKECKLEMDWHALLHELVMMHQGSYMNKIILNCLMILRCWAENNWNWRKIHHFQTAPVNSVRGSVWWPANTSIVMSS